MIEQEIGNKIRILRKEKKMSQQVFAEKTHLDRTYLSRVESGKQNITIETLQQLCAGLGISLEEFFILK